jgi:hypothetical protein
MIIILKPNEHSAQLVHMQEILDETLTEMPTEDRECSPRDNEEFEMHTFNNESVDHSPETFEKQNQIEYEMSERSSDSSVREITADEVPEDMTMDEFKLMKRKQRAELKMKV